MKRVRVIPTLLLDNRKLVKTTQFKSPDYVGDPINALRIFNDKEVDEICVLDISATRNRKPPDLDYIKLFTSECFMPLSYGGGVTTLKQASDIFRAGVEKIVFGTSAHRTKGLIAEVTKTFGSQSVVISVDVKKDWLGRARVFIVNGKVSTGFTPVQFAREMENLGAGELIIQSIERDGMLTGYDLDLVREVTSQVKIPVIIAGGASSLEDFLKAVQAGASAVAAGALFVYKGSRKGILINYPDQQVLIENLYSKA
ncbi:MAG: AglZ/HisF2 family acetamidino modification protein [Flammeovirgaceae bacterium]|nr:AglZ/HisF2 family acetamidino modification protein [Flammeovirgaceae bacterium]